MLEGAFHQTLFNHLSATPCTDLDTSADSAIRSAIASEDAPTLPEVAIMQGHPTFEE